MGLADDIEHALGTTCAEGSTGTKNKGFHGIKDQNPPMKPDKNKRHSKKRNKGKFYGEDGRDPSPAALAYDISRFNRAAQSYPEVPELSVENDSPGGGNRGVLSQTLYLGGKALDSGMVSDLQGVVARLTYALNQEGPQGVQAALEMAHGVSREDSLSQWGNQFLGDHENDLAEPWEIGSEFGEAKQKDTPPDMPEENGDGYSAREGTKQKKELQTEAARNFLNLFEYGPQWNASPEELYKRIDFYNENSDGPPLSTWKDGDGDYVLSMGDKELTRSELEKVFFRVTQLMRETGLLDFYNQDQESEPPSTTQYPAATAGNARPYSPRADGYPEV